MRSLRVVIVAVVFAAATPWVPLAAAERKVSVSPSTGLVQGDEVTVTLSGFNADASVAIGQCPADQLSETACGNLAFHTTGVNGGLTVTYTVHRFLGAIDCGESAACQLGAAEPSNVAGTAVGTPIEFAPASPASAGSLEVSPSNVADGDSISVVGSGWASNAPISLAQCVARSDTCVSGSTVVAVRAGTIAATLLATGVIDDGDRGTVDCTDASGTCSVVAFDVRDASRTRVEFPLTFAARPTPTATVDPSSDLVDGEQVSVRGTGWPLGVGVAVVECPPGLSPPLCGQPIVSARVNADRTFATTYTVAAHIGSTDCRAAAGNCVMYVLVPGGADITLPLTFRPPPPSGSPRRGNVNAAPTFVSSGNNVHVEGDAWATEATLLVGICPARTVTADLAPCTTGVGTLEVGAFSTYVQAPDRVEGANGTVDCTAQAGACVLVVTDPRDDAGTRIEVPLTIVGAIRGYVDPAGAIGVTPGGTAQITGTRWAPSRQLEAFECDAAFTDCVTFGYAQTDEQGSFSVTGTVEGEMGYTDCASAEGACELRIGDSRDFDATTVVVPLVFAPPAPVKVTSHYTVEEHAWVRRGVAISGEPPRVLQREGPRATAWIFTAAHTTDDTAPHVSLAGTITHTTTYSPADYIRYRRYAAHFGYTLEEFQKVGTLFWSWILVEAQD